MKLLRRLRRKGAAREAAATSVFADTQQAGEIWERRRRSVWRYGIWGGLLGAVVGGVVWAPASWLSSAVHAATGGRVQLAQARGTVWRGDAVLVLTGGEGSRDAASLPGRMAWKLGPTSQGLKLTAWHACCLNGNVSIEVHLGLRRQLLVLPAAPNGLGQWPAEIMSGLGTPWNTLELGGMLRLSTPGARIELQPGRWHLDGQLMLDLDGISSRVSTLAELGSYRAVIHGSGPSGGTSLELSTHSGALLVNGEGQWVGNKMRFRGEAAAAEGAENALNNLLNIIGRRQGARSVITIG
jgi:general secretion pathway protein N